MPVDDYSRFFVRHELTFRAKRNQGAALHLIRGLGEDADVRDILEQAYNAGKAVLPIGQDDALELHKLEFREKEGIAVLLFQRGDPRGITQMYKHKKTRAVRRSDRTDDDLIAVSCHVVIKLAEKRTRYPTYDAVVEETLGIGATNIKQFFSLMLGRAPYASNDRHGAEITAEGTCDLKGFASESVSNALENSYIRNVTLVRPGELDDYDAEHVEVKDTIMKLKVTPSLEGIVPILTDLWTKHSSDWRQMRVEMVMPKENKSRIVPIERDMDAAQALFVRAAYVRTKSKIDACCEVINEQLVKEAVNVLQSD